MGGGAIAETLRARGERLLAAAREGRSPDPGPRAGGAELRLLAGPARAARDAVAEALAIAWCLAEPELAGSAALHDAAHRTETRIELLRRRHDGRGDRESALLSSLQRLRAACQQAGVDDVDLELARATLRASTAPTPRPLVATVGHDSDERPPAATTQARQRRPQWPRPETLAKLGAAAGLVLVAVWISTPLQVTPLPPPPAVSELAGDMRLQELHTVGRMLYATVPEWSRLPAAIRDRETVRVEARVLTRGFDGLVLFDGASRMVYSTATPGAGEGG